MRGNLDRAHAADDESGRDEKAAFHEHRYAHRQTQPEQILDRSPARRIDALEQAQVAGLDSATFSYDAQGRLSQEKVGGRFRLRRKTPPPTQRLPEDSIPVAAVAHGNGGNGDSGHGHDHDRNGD